VVLTFASPLVKNGYYKERSYGKQNNYQLHNGNRGGGVAINERISRT
jgi:hypothetical protein